MEIANQFVLGDCLEILPALPDGCADMVLLDLPYGCIAAKWDKRLSLDLLWAQLRRVVKDNTAIVFFANMRFAAELIASNPKEFRYDLVWKKSGGCGFLNANRMPLRRHELVLVFYRKLPKYFPQKFEQKLTRTRINHSARQTNVYGKIKGSGVWEDSGWRYPHSVLKFPNAHRAHPTAKPPELCRWLIRSYTEPGDLVLDCCAGIGTTAIAAVAENRKYFCVEKEPQYFEAAKQYISDSKEKP